MFWCVAVGTRRSFNHFSISNSNPAAVPNRGAQCGGGQGSVQNNRDLQAQGRCNAETCLG